MMTVEDAIAQIEIKLEQTLLAAGRVLAKYNGELTKMTVEDSSMYQLYRTRIVDMETDLKIMRKMK